jgi:periplasmic mercuric ion binding protein
MKALKIFSSLFLLLSTCSISFAQEKTDSFKVAGECGMCKKKIEKAAKTAGASFASWDTKSKQLVVKYSSETTNQAKIQQSIAAVGYDTPDYKTTDEAYNKLDGCCQYDRQLMSKMEKTAMNCCGPNCEMKDGKCDEAVCKDKGCCKDSEMCKEMGCCGHEAKAGQKSKDGKSAMDCGTKSCCKKS